MGIFSKKKTINQTIVDSSLPESNPSPAADALHKTDDLNIQKFAVDLEKLKAQSEANNELRQIFSEKFSRIDEQIGELRTMLVDREKDIQTLEAQATKATDLVSEVQPEKLMIEVKRQDAKLEALKGKLDSHEQINETIMEELKSVRNSIRAFRGVAEIEKMNKELLEDQTIIKKIEGKVEQHSDKVESMFLEVNKKYEEFRRYRELIDNMNTGFVKVNSEFADLKIKFANLASKDDFDKFRNEIKLVTEPLKKDEQQFSQFLTQFKELQKQIEPLIRKYKKFEDDRNIANEDFEKFKKITEEKIDQKIRNYEQIIIRLEKQTDLLSHQNEAFAQKLRDEFSVKTRSLISQLDSIDKKFDKTSIESGIMATQTHEKRIDSLEKDFMQKLQNVENQLATLNAKSQSQPKASSKALIEKVDELQKENEQLKVSLKRLALLTKTILGEVKHKKMI